MSGGLLQDCVPRGVMDAEWSLPSVLGGRRLPKEI